MLALSKTGQTPGLNLVSETFQHMPITNHQVCHFYEASLFYNTHVSNDGFEDLDAATEHSKIEGNPMAEVTH